jgi:hypothetical protein
MAAIDYTIPNQFKGLQLESPINAMTQAVQLRNLQEASQMNALRRQEYQRTREEEGAVRNWFASGKKLDSPEALNELYQIAPGLAPGIEKNILERGKTQAEIGYKQAQTGYENFKARKEQLDFTEKALQSSTTPELARGHIQQAIDLKYVTPEVGAQMLGSVPDNPTQFAAWRTNLLTHSMTAKDQLERAEKLQKARYNQYRFDAMSYGNPVLTEAEWLATEQQQPEVVRLEQEYAPTDAAPAPAPGAAEASPAGTTEDKSFTPVTSQAKKRDFGEGIDPRAAMLLADKPEELAKLMQENYPGSAAFKKRELDSQRLLAQIQHQTIMEKIAQQSENRQRDTAIENKRHARVMEDIQDRSVTVQEKKESTQVNKDRMADDARVTVAKDTADDLERNVDLLIGNPKKKINPHPGLSGITGYNALLPSLPSGQPRAAQQILDNIKGKVTQMGKSIMSQEGKLGNMAVQEWKIVSDAVEKLDPGSPNFPAQLRSVVTQARRLEDNLRNRSKTLYGQPSKPAGSLRSEADKILEGK